MECRHEITQDSIQRMFRLAEYCTYKIVAILSHNDWQRHFTSSKLPWFWCPKMKLEIIFNIFGLLKDNPRNRDTGYETNTDVDKIEMFTYHVDILLKN